MTFAPLVKPAPVLVLFAHPASWASQVNRALADAVRGLTGLCFHDLHEAYPGFDVDAEAERELLRAARLVVLQHPLYWYGPPAIVKHWIDVVLGPGFAYGAGAGVLADKDLVQVITTGAFATAYRPDGHHRYTLAELLRPVEQTARFCGMHYLRPLVVYAGRELSEVAVRAHARRYRDLLAGYPETRPPEVVPGELWETWA